MLKINHLFLFLIKKLQGLISFFQNYLFFFSLIFFLFLWGTAFQTEVQSFHIPKLSRIDDESLLQEILNSRKRVVKPPLARQEFIRVLAYSVDEKRFLFLKLIRVNQKRQQELILVDIDKQETYHYLFNNPILYKRKKKEIIKTYNLINGSLDITSSESEIFRHPRLPGDLLFIRKDSVKNGKNILSSLQIYLDNGRERFLLGKIQNFQVEISPIKVERMYLSNSGRIALFVLSYTYRQDNLIHQNMKVIGFDFYHAIVNPLHKVTAEHEFSLTPEQNNLSFQKNFYYNERDDLLYSEILYHSGLRKFDGDYTLY